MKLRHHYLTQKRFNSEYDKLLKAYHIPKMKLKLQQNYRRRYNVIMLHKLQDFVFCEMMGEELSRV